MSIETDAREALKDYGGCSVQEAKNLIDQLSEAAASLVLKVAAGERAPQASAAEARLALYEELMSVRDGQPVSQEQMMTLFRITENQARTLQRNLAARNPSLTEGRLAEKFTQLKVTKSKGKASWTVASNDLEVLEYGRRRLRRLGLATGIELSETNGTLSFPRNSQVGQGEIDTRQKLGLSEA